MGADNGVVDKRWPTRVALDCRNRVEDESSGGDSGEEVDRPRAKEGEKEEPTSLLGAATLTTKAPGADWRAKRRCAFSESRKVPGRCWFIKQAHGYVGPINRAHGGDPPVEAPTDFVAITIAHAIAEEVRTGQNQPGSLLGAGA